MVGTPTGGQGQPPPDPRKRMDDLLFQESIGTINPQDAADLGTLRQAGRLKGLEGPGVQPQGQATPPTAQPQTPAAAMPAAPAGVPSQRENTPTGLPMPQTPDPSMATALPGQEPQVGANFADALTRRLGYEPIPGEAPNAGSLRDQLYRIANRGVGAFQSGQEEARQSTLPNVNTPLGETVAGGLRVLGHGNVGAIPGAVVESATGSQGAGTAAEVLTNLAPLVTMASPRLLAALPSGIQREIGSTKAAIKTTKDLIEVLKGQIPGAAEKAVGGAERLGGELTKELAGASKTAALPKSLTKASKALEGVDTEAQTVSGLRKAAQREGVAPLTSSGSQTLTEARNLYGGQETALSQFNQYLNRARDSLNPKVQQAAIEKAIQTIETHFPNAKLPELDALRDIHSQIASGKQTISDLALKSSQLGTKLAGRQATIRRLGRLGFGLYGLDRISGAITSALSKSGGPP